MKTYGDKTYCPHHPDCDEGKACPYALTESVVDAAIAQGMPVKYHFERPECFVEANNE